jgi:L-threonylcarbamoyladenylate synthase
VTKVVSTTDAAAIDAARDVLVAGELVVIPTDTVYGLAALLDRPPAVEKIFVVKERDRDLAIPVLVDSLETAGAVGRFDDRAMRLARYFWPGSLTIVVPIKDAIEADLGGDGRSVGLRVPDHTFCLALLTETGPLAATSANPSGDATPTMPDTIVETFGDQVALYVYGGSRGGNPSTVVSLINGPELLREGSVGWSEIRQVL